MNLKLLGSDISIISIILKGLGQIMLQENALCGFLFLAGIFYGSVTMGIAALLAVVCGTATAMLLKYDESEINKGLYGFSAALVGVGVIVFFKPLFICWILIVIGAIAATLLQHFFIKRNVTAFTFPFVLVIWIMLYFISKYLANIQAETALSAINTTDHFAFAFNGYGQVIFQGNFVSGLIFFVAVFISSPIAALYGLAGALLASIVSAYFSVPTENIYLGLFGYNAVLCAIVFAGDHIKDGIWVITSVILSIAISLFMYHNNMIQLTFPFVLASWITLFIKSKLDFVTLGKNK
ncbi:MAG: urea transporter [Bacteroidia bacterium]